MISREGLRPTLTRAEEVALGRRIQDGGPDGVKARNELALRNERLAYRLAKKMADVRHPDFEDAYQEAMIGVLRAAELFDPERGLKFCTYARWFIRRNVFRTIGKATAVRIPRREWGKAKKVEALGEADISIQDYRGPEIALEPEAEHDDLYGAFDVLTDAEAEVVRSRHAMDGWHGGFRLIGEFSGSASDGDKVYQSAITKLGTEYRKRLAG